ncbi:MAG: AMP-binding protein [Acidimicrobiaceae bacterium]|nr:AMP-binding protein [Acidimicrobiaceae bacterium]MCY4280056.1 AMP-binding protein [Acidimicrobiaceae bacterium]MCY4293660.1 AMP-binding protein [Acidimicrobiaceae bacterium]
MSESIHAASTIWDLLCRRVEATPDARMLIDGSGRVLSFAEFKNQAERVAAGLHGMGVAEGTPVTWMLPTRIETVLLSFALSRLGAVQNPIVHVYRRSEVERCIRQTQARLAIHPGVWGGFDYGAMFSEMLSDPDSGFSCRPVTLDGYESLPDADPRALPSPTDSSPGSIRWLYYSFGASSAGSDPKGVQHSDASLVACGLALMQRLEAVAGDVGSMAFPYAHVRGLCYLSMMLAAGAPTLLIESFDPVEAMLDYARHRVTLAGGSAAFYRIFLSEDQRSRKADGRPAMPALRLLSGSGAAVPPRLSYQVREQLGVPLAHGYGMLECPVIAQGSPHDSDEELARSVGRPADGCQVSIVAMSADGGELPAPAGIQGEVRVSGPMLFAGYTDPALNEGAFDVRGRFRTGALGLLSESGHLILTGKAEHIVDSAGDDPAFAGIEATVSVFADAAAAADAVDVAANWR